MTNKVIHANFDEQEAIQVLVVLHVQPEQLQNKYFGQLDEAMADRIAEAACEWCPDLRYKDMDCYDNQLVLHFED